MFSRYGTLVYETNWYQSTWGGISNVDYIFQSGQSDKVMPNGTYFFRLELDTQQDNSEVYTGMIQIQK